MPSRRELPDADAATTVVGEVAAALGGLDGEARREAAARAKDRGDYADGLEAARRDVKMSRYYRDARELAKRLVDFCSGLVYACEGDLQYVGEKVMLLAPPEVELSSGVGGLQGRRFFNQD